MITVPVDLGERSYSIRIEPGILARAADAILSGPQQGQVTSVGILSHPHLAHRFAAPLLAGFALRSIRAELILIPPGERHKNLSTVARVYERMVAARLDRGSILVTLGGGVLGDLGGFAAATYLRGIPFVQIPTTLLAQVDASVGGKTGVDLASGKNLVGAFHQPKAVIIDPDTLTSLPSRELRSGLAEVIKYGIIRDKEFYAIIGSSLESLVSLDSEVLVGCIERSCRIKADIVGADETEQGLRAILNFGHTVGHALEYATNYRRYKHGEAISIGMITACLIGEEIGYTPSCVTESLLSLLHRARLPVAFPYDVPLPDIRDAMLRDKKTSGGRIRFILASEIGEAAVVDGVPDSAVQSALVRHLEIESA